MEHLSATQNPMPNWWHPRDTPTPPEGYAQMVDDMRDLQDTLAAAVPDAAVVAEASALLRRATAVLAPTVRDEWHRISGFVEDLPGRGSALLPVVHDPRIEGDVLRGRVRFGRYHLGGNGAAHGGTIPLMFDDVLGRFANNGGRPVARTAYLHVDFRHITPIERDLDLEVRFVREEGRKRWLTGVIRDGETVCAEAEGLFVQLNPGQS
ncbi:PaaI family thioesterase [Pseudonocardia sp. NPDC049154]|uniref:PaaI family thioesterase n=1 Tax=Pseudonocardia sp. NPDC049154 TaxID=3155501 RepID=UPI0034008809